MLRSRHLFPFALIVLAGACAAQRPLILERAPSQQAVGESGWELSGGASEFYAVHRDGEGDRAAWLLEPVSDTYGKYATWMRHIDASDFRAKRVRITATTRTQGATRRVDFWARAQAVDSPGDGHGLGGDSKHLPPDSAWQVDSIVMDVPTETKWLEYGVGVAGPGKVWLQSAKLELVGPDVPLTHGRANGERAPGPSPVRGWILAGDDPSNFAISIDSAFHRTGRASATLRCLSPHPKGFGTLMQNVEPGAFLGTRVKLSAFIKSEGVSNWAGLWMRVDGSDGRRKTMAFDNMQDRPITGTHDWTRYEIVLDVGIEAVGIAYGVLLHGTGQVWIDDLSFQVVGTDVPTTGKGSAKKPENLDFEQ